MSACTDSTMPSSASACSCCLSRQYDSKFDDAGSSSCELCCASASSSSSSCGSCSSSYCTCPMCRYEARGLRTVVGDVPQLLQLPLAPPYADGFAGYEDHGIVKPPPKLMGITGGADDAVRTQRRDAATPGDATIPLAPGAVVVPEATKPTTATIDHCTQTEAATVVPALRAAVALMVDRDVQTVLPLPSPVVVSSVAVATVSWPTAHALVQTDHGGEGINVPLVPIADAVGGMRMDSAVRDDARLVDPMVVSASTSPIAAAPNDAGGARRVVLSAMAETVEALEAERRQCLETDACDVLSALLSLWGLTRNMAHSMDARHRRDDALHAETSVSVVRSCVAAEDCARAAVVVAAHDAWYMEVVVPFYKDMMAVTVRTSQATVAAMEAALSQQAAADNKVPVLRHAPVTTWGPSTGVVLPIDGGGSSSQWDTTTGALGLARAVVARTDDRGQPKVTDGAASAAASGVLNLQATTLAPPVAVEDAAEAGRGKEGGSTATAQPSHPQPHQLETKSCDSTLQKLDQSTLTDRMGAPRVATSASSTSVNRGSEPRRAVLDHVDLFLPVHERFARAGEIATAGRRGATQRAA